MGKYIRWNDIAMKYTHVTRTGDAAKVASHFIFYAEAELEGRLGDCFAIPFSDNNVTAKDLSIDLAYSKMGILKDKHLTDFRTVLDQRIERIKKGQEVMVTTSGDALKSSVDDTTFFSTTEDYHPTFGMDDAEYLWISSEQLSDEWDSRK